MQYPFRDNPPYPMLISENHQMPPQKSVYDPFLTQTCFERVEREIPFRVGTALLCILLVVGWVHVTVDVLGTFDSYNQSHFLLSLFPVRLRNFYREREREKRTVQCCCFG